jgi:hypothetical protein
MAIEWGQEEEKLVVKEGKGYGGLSIIQNASVLKIKRVQWGVHTMPNQNSWLF